MAAVDTQVIVSRATRQGERTHGRTVPSYGDFKNAFRAAGLGLGNIYRQAAFDRLMQMAQKLVMVSPWVAQPGMAGTSAQKPPSSASCTTTLIFM